MLSYEISLLVASPNMFVEQGITPFSSRSWEEAQDYWTQHASNGGRLRKTLRIDFRCPKDATQEKVNAPVSIAARAKLRTSLILYMYAQSLSMFVASKTGSMITFEL